MPKNPCKDRFGKKIVDVFNRERMIGELTVLLLFYLVRVLVGFDQLTHFRPQRYAFRKCKFLERPNMCFIFEMQGVQEYQI